MRKFIIVFFKLNYELISQAHTVKLVSGGGFYYLKSQGLHLSQNSYKSFQVNIYCDTRNHYSNVSYGDGFFFIMN